MVKTIFSIISIGIIASAQAQQASSDTIKNEIPQIQLITYKDKLLGKIPGSVAVLQQKQINQIAPVSGNDVLRKVAGLNIVDEEGAGLRLNIGVRGLNPDRSRNILMLEDGIPVALNPYGEPELYFTPVIDKVKTVEVLKGSGQIRFGPQTIGGVVNFITLTPPATETATAKITGGQNGFLAAFTSYGNTIGNTGFIISYLRKSATNMGPTWFHLNDLSAKLHVTINKKSSVGIKAGIYDELSNSTYVGITQTMYNAGGNDFTALAPDDRLPVRRYNLSISHRYQFNENLELQTNAFAYNTTRNWRRQDFTFNKNAANQTGVVWGNTAVAEGALYMLNANGNRNRQFEVAGIEPQLQWKKINGNTTSTTHIGTRLLWEKANEQFIIGRKANATAGDLRDDEERGGFATTAYVQHNVQWMNKWSAHAGVRLENFDYKRQINRGRFSINGTTVTADTLVTANGNVFALIPGAGISYQPTINTTLFAGVHKGFAPPRTKDAITSTGFAINIDAEQSWNYEIGIRTEPTNFWQLEATAFLMDFSNQIIPISQSSGNINATGIANGGTTTNKGIELATSIDVLKCMKRKSSLMVSGNVTWVSAQFDDNRYISKNGTLVNIRGNQLPYAPELICNTSIAYENKNGWGIQIFGNYIHQQFADELNTIEPSNNGLVGLIDSRFIVDASAYYPLKKQKTSFTLSAKNLTNERYMVSRRPQGIRVGLPLMVTGTLAFQL